LNYKHFTHIAQQTLHMDCIHQSVTAVLGNNPPDRRLIKIAETHCMGTTQCVNVRSGGTYI